jgi:arsenate reductase
MPLLPCHANATVDTDEQASLRSTPDLSLVTQALASQESMFGLAQAVHPLALHTLAEMHLPTEGYRSKDWAEFARPDAPRLDFVLTVCDKAAGEACPVWPGQPMTAHWGVADPAGFHGSQEAAEKVFWDTAAVLKRRIELMLALPMDALDSMALQQHMRDIGQR